MSEYLRDRYQVLHTLGKRAGRRTVLALDSVTQQQVVIKLLTFTEDFDWADLKLFEREVQTLKHLSHPAIPKYLDSFEVERTAGKALALVQTYIDAPSLQTELDQGRTFSETEVQQMAADLLEILVFLHGRQPSILHRDLKPSNILLQESPEHPPGRVYLVDFGAVQTTVQPGSTLTVVGTYGYMPPEQFGGRTRPASDLYSLGATLIQIVTGTPPADLPQRDLRLEFAPYASLSPALADWLRRMTEPSLDRRFSSAEAALAALRAPKSEEIRTANPQSSMKPQAAIKLEQPAGSRVILTRSPEHLEIVVTPRGFHVGLVPQIIFAIAWNSFLVVWYGAAFQIGWMGLFMGLFALGHLAVGLGIVGSILSDLWGQTRLRLNRQKITQQTELWGLRWKKPKAFPTPTIRQVEQVRWEAGRRAGSDETVQARPHIALWAGTQKFELGASQHLTTPDLDWLAQELSDWLQVPLRDLAPEKQYVPVLKPSSDPEQQWPEADHPRFPPRRSRRHR